MKLPTLEEMCPYNPSCTLRQLVGKTYCTIHYAKNCEAYQIFQRQDVFGEDLTLLEEEDDE